MTGIVVLASRAAISDARCGRSSGLRAMHFCTSVAIDSGMSNRTRRGSGGGCVSLIAATAKTESASNGKRPVRSSYIIAPSA